MENLVIPVILSITIIVAGIFAFIPIDKASTVHSFIVDAILENNLKFSVVTGIADDADDVVTITCPGTSGGCLILDVLFDNNGGADLVIDDASVTIDAFTGDPSFDVFTGDVTIADGVTQYLDEVSGISFGAGDSLVITPTGGSTSDDWSVQVIADIQSDVDDIEIDVS